MWMEVSLVSTMNYYVVLGIAEDAESDTIRSAFRALARRYHPDAGAGSSTAEFRRALEAYETLSDPERRRLYDRKLRDWRVRAAIVAEPTGSRRVPEPLFAVGTVSFGFPSRRVTITRTTFFDELFLSTNEDWFWRWRVR
jgi:curved DNA-binding protein CbpA